MIDSDKSHTLALYSGRNEQKAKITNYEGEFPLKLQIEAGKKFVEVSYDGKTKSPGLTNEKLPSQPKGRKP